MQLDPYNRFYAVTPSDTADFPWGPCEGIFIGGSGVLQVVAQDGTVTAFDHTKGTVLPVKAIRINSTSTSATGIVALYRQ